MRALTYFLEEAAASLWRGRRSGALSIITIAAALFVLGALLLVTWNVEQVLARWSTSAEMSVYLGDDIAPEDRAAIDRVLADSTAVADREYVSKAEALGRFRRDFADLAGLAGDGDNPFPASFEIRLRPEAARAAEVDALAERLAAAPGVADVRYDRRWIERITSAVLLLRGVGLVVVTILIVAAALTVANVVRLACHARRDEIEIMRLVGAPIAYVRGPFVMEGVLQGGIGAVLALVILWGCFILGRARYGLVAAEVLGLARVHFLPLHFGALLILGGMLVGCAGGLVAAASTKERF